MELDKLIAENKSAVSYCQIAQHSMLEKLLEQNITALRELQAKLEIAERSAKQWEAEALLQTRNKDDLRTKLENIEHEHLADVTARLKVQSDGFEVVTRDLRAKLAKAEEWIDKCALKMEELAVGELSSNVFTISSLQLAAKELRKFNALKEGKHE